MDAEGLAKIRALSKRRNEAEEEDEEEETIRDRVRAQPGHGEHFLFASEFSNGPIKKKKKRLEQAKSRLWFDAATQTAVSISSKSFSTSTAIRALSERTVE